VPDSFDTDGDNVTTYFLKLPIVAKSILLRYENHLKRKNIANRNITLAKNAVFCQSYTIG
jgi:hypothetical protein